MKYTWIIFQVIMLFDIRQYIQLLVNAERFVVLALPRQDGRGTYQDH